MERFVESSLSQKLETSLLKGSAAEFGFEVPAHICLEAVDGTEDVVDNVAVGICDEWREIHGVSNGARGVRVVGVQKSGIGAMTACHGEVVALASGDLGVKQAVQGHGETVVTSEVEQDFFLIDQPVQISPDFAAIDGAWTLGRREFTHGLQGGNDHADMRIVLVRRIVGVNDFRLCEPQDVEEVLLEAGL